MLYEEEGERAEGQGARAKGRGQRSKGRDQRAKGGLSPEKRLAVANGTVALDLALMALGIGEGDEVVVTPRTFMASVSCIVNAGARPVF